MTAALVVHSGNMYGGVERVLETFAQAPQLCPGLDPRFALCFEGQISESLRRLGAPLSMLGSVRVTRPDLVLRARRRLAAVLREQRPDVVIMPSVWTHALFAPVVRRAGLPLVLWVHDALTGASWLERLAGRHQPDFMICNSAFSLRAARTVFPSVEAAVIYCPLILEEGRGTCDGSHDGARGGRRRGVRSELQTSDGTTVIITVARMDPYKGHRVLIDALAHLRTDAPWACWIVGGAQRSVEEAYERELKDTVVSRRLQARVRFLGQRTDVAALLEAADLYCHPNQGAEPFGLSIVEALHAGLPVVASGLGGPEEILTDACGRLVPAGDADGLTDAIASLVNDRGLRTRLGKGGPARALELCDPRARLADLADALAAVRLRVAA